MVTAAWPRLPPPRPGAAWPSSRSGLGDQPPRHRCRPRWPAWIGSSAGYFLIDRGTQALVRARFFTRRGRSTLDWVKGVHMSSQPQERTMSEGALVTGAAEPTEQERSGGS